MVDGIPQSTPLRDGKRSGFTVDPAFVERVEVIYGANAIQGVCATGGAINYVTTTAPENGDWLHRVTHEGSTDDFDAHGFPYTLDQLTARKLGAFDFVVGETQQLTTMFIAVNGKQVAGDNSPGDILKDRKTVV